MEKLATSLLHCPVRAERVSFINRANTKMVSCALMIAFTRITSTSLAKYISEMSSLKQS